jgi:hypothetical protein
MEGKEKNKQNKEDEKGQSHMHIYIVQKLSHFARVWMQ